MTEKEIIEEFIASLNEEDFDLKKLQELLEVYISEKEFKKIQENKADNTISRINAMVANQKIDSQKIPIAGSQ